MWLLLKKTKKRNGTLSSVCIVYRDAYGCFGSFRREKSAEEPTDCRVHMCIIWFLSYENFPLRVPPVVTGKWRTALHLSFFFLLLGVPICSSKVIIVLKIPGCEKYFWLRYKGKEWSRTLNEMSAAFLKKKKDPLWNASSVFHLFFFFPKPKKSTESHFLLYLLQKHSSS